MVLIFQIFRNKFDICIIFFTKSFIRDRWDLVEGAIILKISQGRLIIGTEIANNDAVPVPHVQVIFMSRIKRPNTVQRSLQLGQLEMGTNGSFVT